MAKKYKDLDEQLEEEREETMIEAAVKNKVLAFIDQYSYVINEKEASLILRIPDLRLIFGCFAPIAGPDPIDVYLQELFKEGYELRMSSFEEMALFVRKNRQCFSI